MDLGSGPGAGSAIVVSGEGTKHVSDHLDMLRHCQLGCRMQLTYILLETALLTIVVTVPVHRREAGLSGV